VPTLLGAVDHSNTPLVRLKMSQPRRDYCCLVVLNETEATQNEAFLASTPRAGPIFTSKIYPDEFKIEVVRQVTDRGYKPAVAICDGYCNE
jgi:hypothetical protein